MSPRSPHSEGREAVGGVVQFICRLKAAFMGRRLQAAVAAGAAVAAVPGPDRGKEEGRMKNAERAAAGAVSGGREAAQDAGWGHPAYGPQSPQFRRSWRRSGPL